MHSKFRRVVFSCTLPLLASILASCGRPVSHAGSTLSPNVQTTSSDNLLTNAGFEQPWTQGWSQPTASPTAVGVVGETTEWSHSGSNSIKMVSLPGNVEYGIGQSLPLGNYAGEPLLFGAWVRVVGPVVADLRLVIKTTDGNITFREIRQSQTPGLFRRDIIDVPAGINIESVTLICAVRGAIGAAFFDDVVVSHQLATQWATGQPDPGSPLNASLTVHAKQQIRAIPRTLFGTNLEWIYNGHGVWNPDLNAPDPNLLKLCQDMGFSQYRFPGGLFANYYHWQDGIGPQANRPQRTILGTTSGNGFGTDEALAFAQAAGGQLLITVNALTGTPQEAADWVRYVNNGARRVDYWEIGNELYLDLSLLDPNVSLVTPDQYAQKFLDYAAAMKAVDPTIKVGADIDFDYALTTFKKYPDWLNVVMTKIASKVDFVSVHNGFAPVLSQDAGWDVRTVYSSMLAAPQLIKPTLVDLAAQVDQLDPQTPPIFIDVAEWGPLFSTNAITQRFNDHVKTMGSALLAASTLKTYIEDPRTVIANEFQLVDEFTQGWIGPSNGQVIPKASYYVMQLFTQHFGPELLATDQTSPTYEARSMGRVDAVGNVPYLEGVSSISSDGRNVYVIVINQHFDRSITTQINLDGFSATSGTAYVVSSTGIDANTGTQPPAGWPAQAVAEPDGRFYLGGPGEISVTSNNFSASGSTSTYTAPPHSVTALVFSGTVQ